MHNLKADDVDEVYLDNERLLPGPSQQLYNHSPDGFSWGYHGSGPSQLSLAVLQKLKGDKYALNYYQQFMREIIAKLPGGSFNLYIDI